MMYHAVRALLVAVATGVDLFRNGLVSQSRSYCGSERGARSDELAWKSDHQNDVKSFQCNRSSDIYEQWQWIHDHWANIYDYFDKLLFAVD
jgi:hypothetical protein